jgi:L-ribulose-5-phosphate 3-epimerase
MTTHNQLNRRRFIHTSAAIAAGATLAGSITTFAADVKKTSLPKLKLALKYSMIKGNGTENEKIALIKKIGYDGVEIDSPSTIDLDKLNAACKQHGITVHGVIDSIHWDVPFSSADEKVRAKGLEGLKTAIADCKKVGGSTVLVVPGVARDGVSYQECYDRSQAEIKKAIPWAKDAGLKIGIEVVWNDFITKPEQLIKYVDDFKDDTVGAYFDCSNMLKFGIPAETWIRQLGKRMLKFDFKCYSKADAKDHPNEKFPGFMRPIGEGDENWPEILKALAEIGYNGWATSEVEPGDEKYLTDVFKRMKSVLGQA